MSDGAPIPENVLRLHDAIVAQFDEAARQKPVTLTRESVDDVLHLLDVGGKCIVELEAEVAQMKQRLHGIAETARDAEDNGIMNSATTADIVCMAEMGLEK